MPWVGAGWDRGLEGSVGVTPGQQRDPRGYFGFLLRLLDRRFWPFLRERFFLGTKSWYGPPTSEKSI